MSLPKIQVAPEVIEEQLKTKTIKDLAEVYNCSERSIVRYMSRHNLKSPRKQRTRSKIEKWFSEQNRKNLPRTLNSLEKLSGFKSVSIRRFIDSEKIRDLNKAEIVMQWIQDNPDFLWEDKGHSFRTRNIRNLKLSHDRISREIKLLIRLHDHSRIIRTFNNVEEFENHFIKKDK